MNLLDTDWLAQSEGNRWVLAVSGGRDSIAMLHACVHVFGSSKLGDFVICHVNHQLRGAESDADEALVRKLADEYGVVIEVHHEDVASIVENEKKSIELAAREARHKAFAEVCAKHQCDGVWLAHHADDQVETVLYHLLRGASGLKGMQSEVVLKRQQLTLVRPMLSVRRNEINQYIAENELEYREDESNAEPFAVRNRMRNEVLPLLKEVMGRDVVPAVLKSLAHSEQQESFFEEMIDYESMLDPQGRLYLPGLRDAPRVIQQRILHRYLNENAVKNINHDLINAGVNLMDLDQPAKISLPKGRFLRRKEQRIFISG